MRREVITICVATTLCAACSLVSKIDVCDRSLPVEQEVNRLTEGDQFTLGPRTLGQLPSGKTLLVFGSDRSADAEDTGVYLRGALLGMDGRAIPTCSEEHEVTYTEVEPHPYSEPALRPLGAALAPPRAGEPGMIVYATNTIRLGEVMGLYLDQAGCAHGDPVRINPRDDDSGVLGPPAVLALGDGVFLTFWGTFTFDTGVFLGTLTARALRGDEVSGHIRFEGTALSPEGDAVQLVSTVSCPRGVAVTAAGEDRLAVAWYEVSGMIGVYYAIFDNDLNVIVDRSRVHEFQLFTRPSTESYSIDVAYDGAQLLIGFYTFSEDGTLQVFVRFFDGEGHPLRAPDAPEGEAFAVSPDATGDQDAMSLVALPDGGFMMAWQEISTTADSSDTQGAGIRAALFASDGARQFANPVCDRAPFQLNSAHEGDQMFPTLLMLGDGTVLGAWTDDGRNGNDLSGSSVQAVALPPRCFLPLE